MTQEQKANLVAGLYLAASVIGIVLFTILF
jgi:hypothetical protein